MDRTARVLIIGARGAVGRSTKRELVRLEHRVTEAGRSSTVARLDLASDRGFDDLAGLAREHDVVVNASGIEDVRLVDAVGATVLVDISATASYLAALRAAASGQQRVVLGAGLVPGLSTILISALGADAGTDVDVAIVLGSGEVHGPAAVAWTAALAGAPLSD